MNIWPSLDLRRGYVVKLTGGRKSTEWRISDDPAQVARSWVTQGADRLHVVDLDAAFGDGNNRAVVSRVLAAVPGAKIQAAGGMRNRRAIRDWFRRGAWSVVAGTRAVLDRRWLKEAAGEFGKRLWVAVDCRGDVLVTHGWTRKAGLILGEYVSDVDKLPFGGYVYTDVRVEGRHEGFDSEAVVRMAALTKKPVLYAGGVGSLEDLRKLRGLPVEGVILGSALYRGTFTLEQAMRAAS